MIYVEETLNLMPAGPETIETLVSFSEEQLVPCSERLGARLVAAWSSNADAFAQVMNVWEFDDLAAFGAFRANGSDDETWLACQERLEELAPEQSTRLMEALGPVPADVLAEASATSQDSPLGIYSMAILQVAPGKMAAFKAGLEASKHLPIVASWLTIGGQHNEVTDIWKGAVGQGAYGPPDDATRQFFRGLRELAPASASRSSTRSPTRPCVNASDGGRTEMPPPAIWPLTTLAVGRMAAPGVAPP